MHINSDLKDNRALNAARNTIIGFIQSILVTIIPFVVRTIMANILGAEYLGLNSVYMSIMQVLNLAELGFGSVIVFFLYKPAAYGDEELVASYMIFLKRIYQCIGLGIIICGMLVLPFLNRIVGTEAPSDVNIHLLFILFTMGSAVAYFMFPEIGIYFTAYQRNDLNYSITIISWGCTYIIQIIGILLFRSYYIYVLSVALQAFLCGILRIRIGNKALKLEKVAKHLSLKEKKDIYNRTKAMIGHTIDVQLINGVDSIVISAQCGLTAVAIYGNYFYVFAAAMMIADVIYQAVQASIGNAIAIEKSSDNYSRFRCMFWMSSCLGGIISIVMLSTYQIFMRLWMPQLIDSSNLYIIICIYFYISQLRKTTTLFKNAGGMWEDDKLKPYIAMIVNFALDIALVAKIGISGVVFASIITIVIIEIPWETYIIFHNYFHLNGWKYIMEMILYSCINLFLAVISKMIVGFVVEGSSVESFVLSGIISISCTLVGYLLFFSRTEVFHVWKKIIVEMKKNK
ncbi:lipopolysaccharide biosynthesis protein [Butyrivibrio fibrisolvens]|uniref:lipopolysaccharide biosynthesis protein n=1 Tax=Butyrivibrio fibrisolvens TaxID=831 RepID=UPI00200B592B|nr:oligosaccharide flippase family protein [Butyrivibrio fibrisolvens]